MQAILRGLLIILCVMLLFSFCLGLWEGLKDSSELTDKDKLFNFIHLYKIKVTPEKFYLICYLKSGRFLYIFDVDDNKFTEFDSKLTWENIEFRHSGYVKTFLPNRQSEELLSSEAFKALFVFATGCLYAYKLGHDLSFDIPSPESVRSKKILSKEEEWRKYEFKVFQEIYQELFFLGGIVEKIEDIEEREKLKNLIQFALNPTNLNLESAKGRRDAIDINSFSFNKIIVYRDVITKEIIRVLKKKSQK